MAHNIIRPADRNEWLQHRQAGIGSSEVGTIVGVNPYQTPYELWATKKGIIPRKEENFLMKAGHYLEDAVSKFFADETGADIIKSSAGDWLIYDLENPWRRVSPDRIYWESQSKHNERNKRILECKTTQMDVTDSIPHYWYCQLQYQLGVAEINSGALAWLIQGRTFGYRLIDFNGDFFDWMMEQVDKFWIDNIQGNIEPEITSVSDVVAKYPKSFTGKVLQAVGDIMIGEDGETKKAVDIIEACKRLSNLKQEIKDLEKIATQYEDGIKTFMGDAESIELDGRSLITWKSNKPTIKLDTKALTAENPELVQRYMREQNGSRVFRIK